MRLTAPREISTAFTSFHSESSISTTSADSRATSAPCLMAIPTSAKLSAGESLMPSNHSDDVAVAPELANDFGLVGRQHLLTRQAEAPTDLATIALSPVSMMLLRIPMACRR